MSTISGALLPTGMEAVSRQCKAGLSPQPQNCLSSNNLFLFFPQKYEYAKPHFLCLISVVYLFAKVTKLGLVLSCLRYKTFHNSIVRTSTTLVNIEKKTIYKIFDFYLVIIFKNYHRKTVRKYYWCSTSTVFVNDVIM